MLGWQHVFNQTYQIKRCDLLWLTFDRQMAPQLTCRKFPLWIRYQYRDPASVTLSGVLRM